MNKKIKKMIRFNLLLIAINIIMFSNFGFHLRPFMGSGIFGTIIGSFTILMSLILFVKKNRKILKNEDNKKDKNGMKDVNDFKTIDDFSLGLLECMTKRNFRNTSENAFRQLARMKKKTELLEDILLQHFDKESITYIKFNQTIKNVEELFYDNLRKMIFKIRLFDQDEYNNMALTNRNLSTESVKKRNEIYKEYMDYAKMILEKNENLLIKLDQLISEISKLEDIDEENIEELEVMKEVNELVDQVKLYKKALN